MRKRSYVVLLSSLPIWAFALIYHWQFHHREMPSGWGGLSWEVPILLEGSETAAVLLTLIGLALVVIDLIRWIRSL